MRDRLWFFTAGRIQTQSEGRTLVGTNIPYTFKRPTKRFEGKGTYSPDSNHRFQGAYTEDHGRAVEQHVQYVRVHGREQPVQSQDAAGSLSGEL